MKSDTNQLPKCLVLGGGVNGLGAARDLGRAGVWVGLVTPRPNDLAFASKYVREKIVCSDFDDVAFVETLNSAFDEADRDTRGKTILVVCTDNYLSLLSRNRTQLEQNYSFIVSSPESVDTVLDKNRFGVFSKQQGLPVASSLEGSSLDNAGGIGGLAFPVVVKPTGGAHWSPEKVEAVIGHAKARRCENVKELSDCLASANENGMPLVVQEYIPGEDSEHYSYFSFINSEGRETFSFGIRKLRINPIHSGVGSCAEIFEDEELYRKGREICQALNYKGTVSVCFKRSSLTGELVCYEVNGRVPLAHTTGQIAGLSLVRANYNELAGVRVSETVRTAAPRKLWIALASDIRAVRCYIRAGEMSWTDWFVSMLSVRKIAEWSVRDPMPFFVSVKRLLAGA